MKVFETIGKIGIFIYAVIAGGFVFSKLWMWFFVSVFNLPTLTIAQAIGISFTIKTLMPMVESKDDKKSKEEKDLEFILKPLIVPPLLLLMGWMIHLFM